MPLVLLPVVEPLVSVPEFMSLSVPVVVLVSVEELRLEPCTRLLRFLFRLERYLSLDVSLPVPIVESDEVPLCVPLIAESEPGVVVLVDPEPESVESLEPVDVPEESTVESTVDEPMSLEVPLPDVPLTSALPEVAEESVLVDGVVVLVVVVSVVLLCAKPVEDRAATASTSRILRMCSS